MGQQEQTENADRIRAAVNDAPQKVQFSFSDIPKYMALAAFVLYAFGFLIWYAYLGQYGLSPTSTSNPSTGQAEQSMLIPRS